MHANGTPTRTQRVRKRQRENSKRYLKPTGFCQTLVAGGSTIFPAVRTQWVDGTTPEVIIVVVDENTGLTLVLTTMLRTTLANNVVVPGLLLIGGRGQNHSRLSIRPSSPHIILSPRISSKNSLETGILLRIYWATMTGCSTIIITVLVACLMDPVASHLVRLRGFLELDFQLQQAVDHEASRCSGSIIKWVY